MANENGTWIMYGVDWGDPECLHTDRITCFWFSEKAKINE